MKTNFNRLEMKTSVRMLISLAESADWGRKVVGRLGMKSLKNCRPHCTVLHCCAALGKIANSSWLRLGGHCRSAAVQWSAGLVVHILQQCCTPARRLQRVQSLSPAAGGNCTSLLPIFAPLCRLPLHCFNLFQGDNTTDWLEESCNRCNHLWF